MERDAVGARKVDPYHLLFQGGQFYLLGRSHERDALRVFRLSRIRGKVAYATKAEHDFKRPTDFDPRVLRQRAPTGSSASTQGDGRDLGLRAHRLAGRAPLRPLRRRSARRRTARATSSSPPATPRVRQLAAWVLRLGEHARVAGARGARPRRRRARRAARTSATAATSSRRPPVRGRGRRRGGRGRQRRAARETAIRPERFARLVTLASILIEAGRAGRAAARSTRSARRLQVSDAELREDVNVLNVVNFGGGSYVLYAEVHDDGTIEVDPEPYSDNFARPARLLPVEAKALVAAIDLIGDHLPEGALNSRAREDRRRARRRPDGAGPAGRLGAAATTPPSPASSRARSPGRTLLRLEYYKANEDEFSERVDRAVRADQRPRGLVRRLLRPGARGTSATSAWTASRPPRCSTRRFTPRPEVDPAADVEGWPRTGEVEASRMARVWISPERARWSREQRRVAAGARRRRGHRRAAVQGHRLAGARGARRGRRRRRARARPRRATPSARPSAARSGSRSAEPPARVAAAAALGSLRRRMSRRGQITMSDAEVLAFLDEERV